MSRSSSEARVPAALVNQRRADWHIFIKAVGFNCVAIAVLLLLMLIFLRIL